MTAFMLTLAWGTLTAALVVLMMYRGFLDTNEEEQLLLDTAQSPVQRKQIEVMRKLRRVNSLVRLFGAASGALIVVIFCMWIYQGLFAA